MLDREIMTKALRTALKNGGNYADIYFEKKRSFFSRLEDRRIESIQSGTDTGLGIRVIFKGRSAYGYSNELSEGSILALAELVSKAARGDIAAEMLDLRALNPRVDFQVKLPPEEVPADRKIALLKSADRVARGLSDCIRQVSVIYRDTTQTVRIATSEGDIADDLRIHTLAMVQVIAASDGIIQTGYESAGGLTGFELFDETPPEALAEKASKRALMMLKAPRAPAGRMPVVLMSEAGGTMIHEAIGHGLEADLSGQGLSVYAGKLGQRIASELITVVDDATLPGRRGSYRFDDEGAPSRRTVLVENGILKSYMYDRLNAMRDGMPSTGNGRRQSYKHRPIPRMSNTFISPGGHKPENILKSITRGLLVRKMGGGQVNTVNGDFVFDVQEGYIIENGEVSGPVRGATLTGNGPAILNSIDMVGSDLGFAIGTCGKDAQGVPVSDAMPTVRIPDIVIGGAVQ